jgi:predicted phosphodiesterase
MTEQFVITKEIIDQVARERAENPRITYRQVSAKLFGTEDYATILKKSIMDSYREAEVAAQSRIRRNIIPAPYTGKASLPPQYNLKLADVTQVDTKSAIILSDLHLPHIDRGLVEHIMESSRVKNIETLILAGDLLDGQFTGRHKNPAQYVASATDELKYFQDYLMFFEQNFQEVVVMPGNHDEWVMDYFECSFADLIGFVAPDVKLTVSEYSYVFVNDNLVIGHLEEWNEVPGYLAWKIGNVYNRNALVGHDHIRGVYTENKSPIWGASIGASLVSDNIYYKRAAFNSFPAIQCGYAELLDKNEITLYAWDGTHAKPENILTAKVLK